VASGRARGRRPGWLRILGRTARDRSIGIDGSGSIERSPGEQLTSQRPFVRTWRASDSQRDVEPRSVLTG